MKKNIYLFLIVFMAFAFKSTAPIKIIFFGDSITQAGVGAGGYITKIGDKLSKLGKKSNFELIGAGIGGNKIYDLYLRLEEDVLSKKPDLVFIYVGVNDVWHKASYGTGTDVDKFEKFYQATITKIVKNGAKVILCTPACIGEKTDFSNNQDGDLNQYSKIIRNLATKNNLQVVDLRQAFLDYNSKNNAKSDEKGILTTDRVHLNNAGNELVADMMMKVILP